MPESTTTTDLDTQKRLAAMALLVALERNRQLTEQVRQATAPTAAEFAVMVEAEMAKGLTELRGS